MQCISFIRNIFIITLVLHIFLLSPNHVYSDELALNKLEDSKKVDTNNNYKLDPNYQANNSNKEQAIEDSETSSLEEESNIKSALEPTEFYAVEANDTKYVSDTNSLKLALIDKSITTIIITENLNLGNQAFPVNHSVVIDGNGNTLTYSGGISSNSGIFYYADNVTIHYKNLNFGFKSELGKSSRTNANNYYGIAPPGSGRNKTLIVENVNYYSDYGAQPFYINQSNDKLIFRGKNEFILMGKPGTNSQEFAEANNIMFDEGSNTNIIDNNMEQIGFIWTAYSPLNFTVGKNAYVNITTNHDFLYSDSNNPSIKVLEGGSLKIYQNNNLTAPASGKIIYQSNKNLSVLVEEKANFAVRSKQASSFANLAVSLGKDSKSSFSVSDGSIFKNTTPLAFNLDNMKQLDFISEGKSNIVSGVLGSYNAKINFSNFSPTTLGYDVYVNDMEKSLLSQFEPSAWYSKASGFSRENFDFTLQEKEELNHAKNLILKKDTTTVISFNEEEGSIEKEKQVSIPEIDTKEDFSDYFYWSDIDSGNNIVFELWDSNKKLNDIFETVTDGTIGFNKINYIINKNNISSGENNFYIKVFKKLSGNQLYLQDTINLQLTVKQGELKFISVPESLNWTKRLVSQSKGILKRDAGNIMELKVSDTRLKNQDWKVTANVIGNSNFSLVWKDVEDIVNLDGQVVLTNSNSNQLKNIYSKSWSEDLGILLKSDKYLEIGDYSKKLTILWTLSDVDTEIK